MPDGNNIAITKNAPLYCEKHYNQIYKKEINNFKD